MTSSSAQAPVLIGTDLGVWGDLALTEAHRWASESGAPLVVLHVMASLPEPLPWKARGDHGQRATAEVEATARAALAARVMAVTSRGPDDFEAIVAVGTPHIEIVRAAEARHAALVVVGAHGASSAGRVRMGHSAEKVARYAHCPVLVVRPGRMTGGVLVADDLSRGAESALRAAAEVARRRGVRVTALYVIDTGMPFPVDTWSSPVDPATASDQRAQARAHLADHLTSLDLDAEARIGDGPVLTALEDTARELEAGLVVVGTIGRTGLARILLGNTAEDAIRDLPCSVLVVRSTVDPAPGAIAEAHR